MSSQTFIADRESLEFSRRTRLAPTSVWLSMMFLSEPPSIQERPEVVRVACGDPVRLECSVPGRKDLGSYRKYPLFHKGNLHFPELEFCEFCVQSVWCF